MIDKLLTASANAPHDWLENTSYRLLFASACFFTLSRVTTIAHPVLWRAGVI